MRWGLLRLWRALRSRGLAMVLILLLVLLCSVATVVPQKGGESHAEWRRASPTLSALAGHVGADAVLTSLPFMVAIAAVAVSVVACTVPRLRGLKGAPHGAGFLRGLLSRQRLIGSAVFHMGILVTLAGGVTSALTRFEGRITVGEGQTLELAESSFSSFGMRGALSSAAAPFHVRLVKFRPNYETGWGCPDYASDVAAVADGKARAKATVRVNAPFVHRGVTLYQGKHGFALRFIYAERESRTFFRSYVALETDLDSDPVRYRCSFPVTGSDVTIDAEFFPDAVYEDGKLRTRSPEPRNPAAHVTVRRGDAVVFSGPIARARPVELGKGVALGLGTPRYWSEFTVVKDSGVWLVFIGAWIVVAGLCVRFLPAAVARREQEGNA